MVLASVKLKIQMFHNSHQPQEKAHNWVGFYVLSKELSYSLIGGATLRGPKHQVRFFFFFFFILILRLDTNKKLKLFYYLVYFYYYSWTLLHFLILFIGLIIIFQLTFIFIYDTFSNKFLVSTKLVANPCDTQKSYIIRKFKQFFVSSSCTLRFQSQKFVSLIWNIKLLNEKY